MATIKKVLFEIVSFVVGLVCACVVMIAFMLMVGCSVTRTAPESTLTDAERACFSGTMQAYQKVGRDEKVSVVCK